jgi:SpoVK/Ycf46/Vps4 family AAA+-type ATPase
VAEIMKDLPQGVDETAAKQIFTEIVIQGDEVHWDDVAGLEAAKSALKETVVYPFLRPDLFMGLREPARGMLLFGPPGTGKTMLARAVATESKSTFFAISASSLTSKFMGESEKLVRALFVLAKRLAPSIIFVDEIDSLLSARGGSSEHEASRRIKTEFLIQWSDLQRAAAGRDVSSSSEGDATRVLVLAATNLPWAIDEAARRRFVRRQYIPLPEDHVREKQLRTLLAAQKHSLRDRDLKVLVQVTDGEFHFPPLQPPTLLSILPSPLHTRMLTLIFLATQATPAPTSPPSPRTPPWAPCAPSASSSCTWAPTKSVPLACAISRPVW